MTNCVNLLPKSNPSFSTLIFRKSESVTHYNISIMIPKITVPKTVPFELSPRTIIQILKCIVTKTYESFITTFPSLRLPVKANVGETTEIDNTEHEYYYVNIDVEPDKITTSYIPKGQVIVQSEFWSYSGKWENDIITYSRGWTQVMYVLINTTNDTKELILRALKLFPEKLLLMIHLLMSTQHLFLIGESIIPHYDISTFLLSTFLIVWDTHMQYTHILSLINQNLRYIIQNFVDMNMIHIACQHI